MESQPAKHAQRTASSTPAQWLEGIRRLADQLPSGARLMEVCGTHTMAIARHGLHSLLPPKIRLISGPGCPVCVTPTSYINAAIELARRPDTVIATFGDMIKVPGSESSLEQEKARGARIAVVYSPYDAINLATANPGSQVVFLAVGFETTTPATALAAIRARSEGLKNFSLLTAHKLIPPALRILLSDAETRVDGFLLPGHVSVIIGARAYRFVADEFRRPCVVAGFEPLDILHAIAMLLTQMTQARADVEIQYRACVSEQGNVAAQRRIAEVFHPCDTEWRGLGMLPASGLTLKPEWAALDAEKRFGLRMTPAADNPHCACGNVLRGKVIPPDCRLFARACTPTHPIGPCMVSSEGTCAAYFKYRRQ